MDTDVRRNDEAGRYELWLNGVVVGIADYTGEGTLTFPHTEISRSLRGQGLGDVLVRAALDDVRARGEKVRPACWFVDDFIRQHPDYADLRAA